MLKPEGGRASSTRLDALPTSALVSLLTLTVASPGCASTRSASPWIWSRHVACLLPRPPTRAASSGICWQSQERVAWWVCSGGLGRSCWRLCRRRAACMPASASSQKCSRTPMVSPSWFCASAVSVVLSEGCAQSHVCRVI